jgi:predicted nucleic acid-binding protein
MSTYIDSSAFLAVIDADDRYHPSAISAWQRLLDREEPLVISSYTLIETIAVMHRRLGTQTVRRFLEEILPAVEVVWADVTDHKTAVLDMLVRSGKSGPSIVDCMSFHVIRQRQIGDVFTYDKHFQGHGFNLIG